MRSMNMSLLWLSRVQFSRFSTRFSWSSKMRSEKKEEREQVMKNRREQVSFAALELGQ